MNRRLTLLAIALFAAVIATGAAPRPGAVVGVWAFKTATYDHDCVMSGQLLVQPDPTNGAYVCQMRAFESCGKFRYRAEETCTLSEKAGTVTIISQVTLAEPSNYAPDDFTLKIETESRMVGQLRSAGIVAPVVFTRGPDAIS